MSRIPVPIGRREGRPALRAERPPILLLPMSSLVDPQEPRRRGGGRVRIIPERFPVEGRAGTAGRKEEEGGGTIGTMRRPRRMRRSGSLERICC